MTPGGLSAEKVRRMLRAEGPAANGVCDCIKNALVATVQTASHRKMREQPPEHFILAGARAENTLTSIHGGVGLLEMVSAIIELLYPASSGAAELLRTVLYF